LDGASSRAVKSGVEPPHSKSGAIFDPPSLIRGEPTAVLETPGHAAPDTAQRGHHIS
jgi:hypothetical protein